LKKSENSLVLLGSKSLPELRSFEKLVPLTSPLCLESVKSQEKVLQLETIDLTQIVPRSDDLTWISWPQPSMVKRWG